MARSNNVSLDLNKCSGCNHCISECPISIINEHHLTPEGKIAINIRPEYCIDCTCCIKGCGQEARYYEDDTERFFGDLSAGKKINIIFAPAFKTNYADWKKVLTLLRKLGAKKIYDTSFGAEICTWAYLKFITQSGKSGWISQPCPVIVNLIEKYYHKLLPKLIPIHSPMMCTAVYMQKYADEKGPTAFLSPCVAKKDEISRNSNYFQYNVTYKNLMHYISSNKLAYHNLEDAVVDSPAPELGSFFPIPGGLRENVEFHTHHKAWVRQIEGTEDVVKYFDQYENRLTSSDPELPLLIDVLNCMRGCNGGTGTDKNLLSDDIERRVFQLKHDVRTKPSIKKHKYNLFKDFDKRLRLDDFKCSYKAQHLDLEQPDNSKIEDAFIQLKKYTAEERNINCRCCGYVNCSKLAEMIARGINTKESCVYLTKKLAEESHEALKIASEKELERAADEYRKAEGIQENVAVISERLTDIKDTAKGLNLSLKDVMGNMRDVSSEMVLLVDLVNNINTNMSHYIDITNEIVKLSEKTKLLSLNAGIEAANAGQYGKGFAVVAESVRDLAQKAKVSAASGQEINVTLEGLLGKIKSISDEFVVTIDSLHSSIEKVVEQNMVNAAKTDEVAAIARNIVS